MIVARTIMIIAYDNIIVIMIKLYCETDSGLVTQYRNLNLDQIRSGNGLVPSGTEPLPELMWINHQ